MRFPFLHSRRKTHIEEAPANTSAGEAAAESEIEEYLDVREQRRWIFPRAALVGIGSGIMAVLFRTALAGADRLRDALINGSHRYPAWGWTLPLLFCAAGAVIAIFLTRRYAPETSGSGIPHLEAVLHRFRALNWRRVLPIKFIGGLLAIGGGLALGREGPTVQMGGAVGDAISDWLKVSPRERLTLISAGAGAGLAAVFNAPISGLMFVLEEVRRDFQPVVFGAVFVAAIIADVVSRLGAGPKPVFSVPNYPMPPLASLPVFALLGIIMGGVGVLFNKALMFTTGMYAKIPDRFTYLAAGITGGIIGLFGWFYPALMSSGGPLAEAALNGRVILLLIPFYFGIRFLFTATSYGTGVPGGIFSPLLVQGALAGLAIGLVFHDLAPSIVPIPAVFAVVGMAAYFAAIVRAPLTGIMLIIEMTGNYSQTLPLLVACFCSYIVAESLKDLPIYEALLERDLKRAGSKLQLEKPIVMEFAVVRDAPFAGKQIRSLGLPAGCIIVRCSDGKREWVPRADTRLVPHMRITAVIAPEATEAIGLLHEGCNASVGQQIKNIKE